MDNDIQGYKCLCCGSPLVWNAEGQIWKCTSCDNTYNYETLMAAAQSEQAAAQQTDQINWNEYQVSDMINNMVSYTCPSCGGEIVVDGPVAASRCPYCDNVAIMQPQVTGMIRPDYIIPFRMTKEDAKAALRKFYEGKKLLPDRFSEENHMDEITGIYVPFWLFDCDASANLTFDATTVTRWRDSAYDNTKIDHYLLQRGGTLSFRKVPVDGSTRMEDSFMDAIEPYDYSGLVPFDQAYLSGFVANKPDVDVKNSLPRATDRVINSTVAAFSATAGGYASVTPKSRSVQTYQSSIKYAMLPVWLLTTRYMDKVYTFAMNGQTGKLVGTLPVDEGKYKRQMYKIAGIVAGIAIVLTALIGGVFK